MAITISFDICTFKGYKLDYTHRVVNASENVLNLNELDYSKDFNEPKSE